MQHIALIGAGQLGSRHLQALALCKHPVTLHVVEPNPKSLSVAKERFEEIRTNDYITETKFLLSMESLENDIDFCIIATGADSRLAVLQRLVERVSVKNMLLEKVLFQSADEYQVARKIIENLNIAAWVNCPRRMSAFHREIKKLLNIKSKITYRIIGGEWGLGCNAIHFIDYMAFLTNSVITSIDTSTIDKTIRESKRPGFIEFTGCLRVLFEDDSELELISTFDNKEPMRHSINTDTCQIDISESEGRAIIRDKISGNEKQISFYMPYQSQLTNLVAEEILLKGSCKLTKYDESMKLHLPLVKSLLAHLNHVTNDKTTILPIT